MEAAALKILVVDDHADTGRTVAMLLEMLGHSCEVVGSAEEALAKEIAGSFDMLLTDVRLPGADGWELVRRLEAESRLPAHVIFMSAWVMDERWRTSQEVRRYPHLNKPIRLDELVTAFQRLRDMHPQPPEKIGTTDLPLTDSKASIPTISAS